MAIQHTIAGLSLPQTRTASEVLGDMETAVRSILSHPVPPPCPECLIARGQLRYAFEPEGRDEYLGWWQWPLVPTALWEAHREHLWSYVPHSMAKVLPLSGGGPLNIPPGWTAIDDCDGLATHAVAWHRASRQAWPMVQEFRSQDRLRGWHALAVLELEEHQQHPAEIPMQPLTVVMDNPYPMTPRPGKRLVSVDLAWMAGMPRVREGRYPLERLALRRINPH